MSNLKRKFVGISVKASLIVIAFMLVVPDYTAYSQVSRKRLEHIEAKQKFPDQYSDLDTKNTAKAVTDELIVSTLESSRQNYLQALILIKRGDTLSAARHFQQAIDILNKLVSYPNIEQNADFNDLAQSIVEDYETYITKLESLDENASLFIIRDKLFQEIENLPATPGPKQTIVAKPAPIIGHPNKHSNPDKVVIPLVDHVLVDKNITFLTKNKRGISFMKQCLERTGKWFPMIKRIAANEGMPEELMYLSIWESGLNPTIVSKASAVGLWQFMRATGQDYKLNEKDSYWVDERRDPEKSTRAAMKHLRDLYYEFGDWHLALAAYNCGTGCVRRAVRRSGKEKPSFWDIMHLLPKETSNYVPQFIATTRVAMNPELYGIEMQDIKFQDEYKYDLFQVNEPTNLTALAKAAGISLEELKELNTELLQNITPADRKTYMLKIPYNSINQFTANFALLTPEEKQPFVSHKVDRNETLAQIARKYGVSTSDLVEINGLSGYKAKIKRGDELRIPVGNQAIELQSSSNADMAEAQEPATKSTAQNVNTELDNIGQIVTHTVQRGESIYSIANRYGIRTTDLRNLNNLSFDDDNIQVGQKLIIAKNRVTDADFADSKQNAKQSKSVDVRHKVKRGETLARIADNYGTTIDAIKSQNKLKSTNIKEGQVLNIKSSQSVSNEKRPEPAKQETLSVHLVKRGESLSSIAQQYGVSEAQLREWNKDDISGDVIIAGSRIKVQVNPSSVGSAPAKTKGKTSAVYYKVKRGDTLGSIARRYGVTVNSIVQNNKNVSEKNLQIGQTLRIK